MSLEPLRTVVVERRHNLTIHARVSFLPMDSSASPQNASRGARKCVIPPMLFAAYNSRRYSVGLYPLI